MTVVVVFHGHILIPASSENALIGDNIQVFYAVFTSQHHRGQMAQLRYTEAAVGTVVTLLRDHPVVHTDGGL